MNLLQGYILLDKPKGWTSFDVVNYVRKIIAIEQGCKPRQIKVGHTGTLDPMATGLLVLLIGKATKQAPQIVKAKKCYEAEITFGAFSTTDDAEGDLKPVQSSIEPTKKQVEKSIGDLLGESMQTPPIYSAIKVNGKRAYSLARDGKDIALKARPIVIYEAKLHSYEYPIVDVSFCVSSGTYIRSLARTIGEQLTCGGYLSALRRTKVDNWDVINAVSVEELDYQKIVDNLHHLDDSSVND